ncbi:hypothetical protein [Limosilactobacillus fermentum]|uniref:hypothetical protein n=1 Tax=Limosilactobacillus fermentum TaxID=1613 RepID=UPI001C9E50E1|nr:hypothetical protein [Limosilactobacillus fermentum]
MMKKVMTNAWMIAKNAAKKFGGKAIEYIAGALKMAWKMAKGLTEEQVRALIAKGFSRWTKYDKDRLYFDLEKAGLMEIDRYKSGRISYSEFQGESISHSLASKLLGVKVWIDVQTGEMYSKSYDEENKDIVVALAKKALHSI